MLTTNSSPKRFTSSALQIIALSIVVVVIALNGQSQAATLNVPANFATIQAAVDAASVGDTVMVADGVYTGGGNTDISPLGKDIVIKSSGGSAVCTIDCAGSPGTPHRAFAFENSESSAMKVEGFSIKNGYPPVFMFIEEIGPGVFDTIPVFVGGAIACFGASPTFEDLNFFDNSAEIGGAVACALGSNSSFSNCEFSNNHATMVGDGSGGGIFVVESSVSVTNCNFMANTATNDGGAIGAESVSGNTLTIDNSFFGYNSADSCGGALSGFGVGISATNSVFSGNQSSFIGGVALISENGPLSTFNKCTFAGNKAAVGGAGSVMHIEGGVNVSLSQCIAYENGLGSINIFAFSCFDAADYSFSCTDMWNNGGGDWDACAFASKDINGNFSADPMFCLTDSTDFSIDVKSPCAAANNSCGLQAGARAPVCDVVVGCCVTPGDFNHDGVFNISDLTAAIDRVFSGGPGPLCQDEADSNSDSVFNIADITHDIARIFSGGAAPICGTTGT